MLIENDKCSLVNIFKLGGQIESISRDPRENEVRNYEPWCLEWTYHIATILPIKHVGCSC